MRHEQSSPDTASQTRGFHGLTQLTNKNPLKGKDDELSIPMDCHWRGSHAERFYVSSLKERKNPNQD